LATEQFSSATSSPEAINRTVAQEENRSMYETHIRGRLQHLSHEAIAARACFYTNAPDGDFVVDRDPANERALIVSACSGHGFKHSAALGAHVAAMLNGKTSQIADFALDRPALRASQQVEA
jgi:sarcosine oxidase